ncbi:MAG: tetratricopeptide repeat protein [Woeseia sp.]
MATRRRIPLYLTAALSILALGYFVLEKFDTAPSTPEISSDSSLAGKPQTATPPPAVSATADLSIAILPFENTSADADQDYLSEGISRELFDLLSEIPQLALASRGAAFQFKSNAVDAAAAARELEVAQALTGSVRKTDGTVQISTRLIRAEDEAVLWSASYDRPLQDIFAIQDEIVASVAAALGIQLGANAPQAEVVDPEAYLLWLQGRYFYDQWGEENFERAVDANRAALKIDPNFVEAWASLAVTYLTQTQSGYREIAYGTALTRDAIDKALAIDPDRASVLARLAHVQLMIEWDWNGAAETLERALRVAPNDTRVLGAAAYLASCFGRSDEALGYLQRALAEDPKNPVTMYNYAEILHRAGRLNDATAAYRRLLEINPQDPGTHTQLAIILLQQNKPEAAWAELELETEPQQQAYGRLLALPALGRGNEVDERLEQFIEKNQSWGAYLIANVYAWHGDQDNAFLWLDHAYQQRAATITHVLLEPTLLGLHDDPRWSELLGKLGLQQ